MLPSHAPPEFINRETLWNSAEKSEKQWNSQLARCIVLALPRELDREAQIEMLQRYCREQFVARGMCVDFTDENTPDSLNAIYNDEYVITLDELPQWSRGDNEA